MQENSLPIYTGWIKAFGRMLCDELNRINTKCRVTKNGDQLDVFPYSPVAYDVLAKYAEIGKHVCIYCGKPDVKIKMVNGKLLPVCKGCWSGSEPYDDDRDEIPSRIKIIRYNPVWRDTEIKVVDISALTKKIRDEYRRDKHEKS